MLHLFKQKILSAAFAGLTILASMSLGMSISHDADLKIGLYADVSILDPHFTHFNNIAPNISLSSHLFDALVNVDANGHLILGLATSWKAIDPLTWKFKLRHGVKFSDGSELTADDASCSLWSAPPR